MALWNISLEWDTVTIANSMIQTLKDKGFTDWKDKELNLVYGMNDDNDSAFIIYAKLGDYLIRVFIQNQKKNIQISQGHNEAGKPDFKQDFSDKQQKLASDFFEKMIKACKDFDE